MKDPLHMPQKLSVPKQSSCVKKACLASNCALTCLFKRRVGHQRKILSLLQDSYTTSKICDANSSLMLIEQYYSALK